MKDTTWTDASEIAHLPQVEEALMHFSHDSTPDNAVGIVLEVIAAMQDSKRLDYIEQTFSGMTNRERYLPVTMVWGKGAMGRTLREAVDKYMKEGRTR